MSDPFAAGQGTANVRYNVHRNMRQKEITISMTDGKFAKNDVVIHYTGLEPNFDINQAVKECSDALEVMKDRNPIEQPASAASRKLEKQFDRKLEAKDPELTA